MNSIYGCDKTSICEVSEVAWFWALEAKKVKRTGSHNCKFVHQDRRSLRLAGQHGSEFKTGTLRAMLKQAGLEQYTEQDILDA